MFKKTMLAGVLAAMAATVMSAPASAAVVQCVPNLVEYAQGTLLIQCPLGNFLAQVTPPASCGTYAQNLETQKIWASQGQAALLSGKGLRFYFTICGGTNYIQVVDLFN